MVLVSHWGIKMAVLVSLFGCVNIGLLVHRGFTGRLSKLFKVLLLSLRSASFPAGFETLPNILLVFALECSSATFVLWFTEYRVFDSFRLRRGVLHGALATSCPVIEILEIVGFVWLDLWSLILWLPPWACACEKVLFSVIEFNTFLPSDILHRLTLLVDSIWWVTFHCLIRLGACLLLKCHLFLWLVSAVVVRTNAQPLVSTHWSRVFGFAQIGKVLLSVWILEIRVDNHRIASKASWSFNPLYHFNLFLIGLKIIVDKSSYVQSTKIM